MREEKKRREKKKKRIDAVQTKRSWKEEYDDKNKRSRKRNKVGIEEGSMEERMDERK